MALNAAMNARGPPEGRSAFQMAIAGALELAINREHARLFARVKLYQPFRDDIANKMMIQIPASASINSLLTPQMKLGMAADGIAVTVEGDFEASMTLKSDASATFYELSGNSDTIGTIIGHAENACLSVWMYLGAPWHGVGRVGADPRGTPHIVIHLDGYRRAGKGFPAIPVGLGEQPAGGVPELRGPDTGIRNYAHSWLKIN